MPVTAEATTTRAALLRSTAQAGVRVAAMYVPVLVDDGAVSVPVSEVLARHGPHR